MKKYIAHFKSGSLVNIPEEAVDKIYTRILEGAKEFQCNTIYEDDEKRFLIINLLEVDYIACTQDLA